MIVIADSNIIVSALITPKGVVASVFNAKSNLQFLTVDYLFDEVESHFDKIVKLSKRPQKEVWENYQELKAKIKTVVLHTQIPQKYINEAYYITLDVDGKDVYFIALQRYKKHKLWTSDKALIKGVEAKGYDIFITTAELRAKLYKK
ncbi:MAG: PIN domain nuclease [Flavobacteriaceae bacterium]|jgi:predicted nucleic acid-binding protein|nr:PIN domain nuclease [Flavobacteriaceae bacterium]